jgi:F0F1-type ATP synthase assembly protein I
MTSLVVAAGLALVDNSEALAALMAGVVCVIPGGYFAWRATVERSPARLLGQGVMKFLLTVTLMALAFAAFQPAPLGFFAAFVLMQTMYVLGPVVFAAFGSGPAD